MHDPDAPLRLLTLQFLAWADRAPPRTYAEAMEAWRTSCPRLPVWEEALDGGLVRVSPTPGACMSAATVHVTERGRALLQAAAPA